MKVSENEEFEAFGDVEERRNGKNKDHSDREKGNQPIRGGFQKKICHSPLTCCSPSFRRHRHPVLSAYSSDHLGCAVD